MLTQTKTASLHLARPAGSSRAKPCPWLNHTSSVHIPLPVSPLLIHNLKALARCALKHRSPAQHSVWKAEEKLDKDSTEQNCGPQISIFLPAVTAHRIQTVPLQWASFLVLCIFRCCFFFLFLFLTHPCARTGKSALFASSPKDFWEALMPMLTAARTAAGTVPTPSPDSPWNKLGW